MKILLSLLLLFFGSTLLMQAQDDLDGLKKRYKKYYSQQKKKMKKDAGAEDAFIWDAAKGPKDFGNKPYVLGEALTEEEAFEKKLNDQNLVLQIKGGLMHQKAPEKSPAPAKKTKMNKDWQKKLTKDLRVKKS